MSTLSNNNTDFDSAVKLIADEYVINIVHKLQTKGMRFNELQRSVTDICPATLTDRLKRLESENIVTRKEETVDKVSVVYELTKKGRGILPIIKAINTFAVEYENKSSV